MQNSTYPHPSVLTLSFGEMRELKYFYSVLILFFFVITILVNSAVIITVILHKSLQQPMYVFICALCINGLYGSTAFFPSLFVNLISISQTISYIGCLTQVFCLHTYIGCEMSVLAVMAFDRYVCICNPLRYNHIMSLTTVFKLIAGSWLYTIIPFTSHFILTIRLPLCDSVILKIYCDNWSIVKLSCVDTTVNNIYGLVISGGFLVLMPAFIIYSYVEILRICARSSKEFRAKSLQTCTPHLTNIIIFLSNRLLEVVLNRSTPKDVSYELRTVLSMQVFVLPPLINPLMYGLKMEAIRVKLVHLTQKIKKMATNGYTLN